ncbi:MAG: hypothetical protein L3J37_10870 [Rhodobacteraceae bacterium]|nr:hypothetical protein [Paracoccaceae bacterium]
MTHKILTPGIVFSHWAARLATITGLVFAVSVGMSTTAQAQNVDWLVQIGDTGFDPMAAGGDIEYTVQVHNNGFDDAPVTTMDIILPVNAEMIGATGTINNCTPLPATGPITVTCDVPALAASGGASMVAVVRSSVAGVINVLADVPVSAGGVTDIDAGNNIEVEATTITTGSDIGVELTVPPTASAGSYVDLEFVATNHGPNIANNFELTFPVPTGLVDVTPPAGCTLSLGIYTCLIAGPLNPGDSVPLTFNGQISAAGGSTLTAVGSVVNSDPVDPISSNNTDIGDIAVTSGSDVSISKSRSPSGTLLLGDIVDFTLAAQYTGDSPTGLTITDTIPGNYQIDSVTAPGWTCTVAGQNVSCTRASGTVAGSDVSLGSVVIETTVISPGTAENTAVISSTGPVDPDMSNNTATDGGATIEEPVVDLSAHKTGPWPALGVVGGEHTYWIRTSNVGNAAFFGTIVMVDSLPAGMTVDSANLNGWTCSPAFPVVGPQDITCERVYTSAAPLAAGAATPNVALHVTLTAAGTLANGLVISSPDANIPETNLANNTVTHTTTVTTGPDSADLDTIKTAAVDPIAAGEVQTYTLEIVNDGPTASEDIRITDNLENLINNSVGATGAGFISATLSPGLASGLTCTTVVSGGNSRELRCEIVTLPVCTAGNDCPVITVDVRPGLNAGPRTNTFRAISRATPDPDLDNNTANAGFNVLARVDVAVTKVASPDPVAAGQVLAYVITARNLANGLSSAENVSINDALPNNMTFISATPSAGVCGITPLAGSVTSAGNNMIGCNLGTLANGAQATVTVLARPNFATMGSVITNAVVVATSTTETDLSNNTDTVDVTVEAPDLDILVNKDDSVDPVIIGDDTVYTITITNAGPSASENVVMTDIMPATRLSYQSHVVSGAGVCSTVPAVGSLGQTLICTWPYLASGASETVEITARGVAKGSSQNTVAISSDEIVAGFDRLAANNDTSEITTVRTRTDIEVVSKIPSSDPIALNEDFSFTALVRVNTGQGLGEADDVVFSDTLPAGMVLTGAPVATVTVGSASSTVCTGGAGDNAFTCDLGTVSSGGEVTILIPVEVISVSSDPQTLTNTATVSTSSADTVPANNTNSGQVSTVSSSISGTVFRDFADDTGITAGDTFVNGVTITLVGTSFDGQPINLTTTTDPSGNFTFPYIPEGDYTLTRGPVSETYLTDGTNTAGSEGGTVSSPTVISAISVPSATDAIEYLFPLIPQARVGIAKEVSGAVVTNADGSFNTTFQMVIENFSLEALINMEVTDPLAGAAPLFGTYESLATPATDPLGLGSYTILTQPAGSCGGLNSGFDGSGDNALANGFSLASGSTCTISFSLRVQPTNPLPPVLASGGRYENQATVTGEGELSGQTSATNPELIDISNNGTDPDPNGDGSATGAGEGNPTPVIPNIAPAIALIKTADASAVQTPPQVGDVISYSFSVENTGNVVLTNVILTETLIAAVLTGGPIASLAPGDVDTTTYTATYTLTQDDINAGEVINSATTTGTPPSGPAVTDVSGSTNTDNTPTVVPLTPSPAIALIKTADASAVQSPAQVGDVISYSFRIENTGNVTLTNVTLSDVLAGLVMTGGPIASMAPGDVDTATYSATYVITQDDINAGEVINSATTSGTPPTGPAVTDVSGSTNTDNTPTVVPLDQEPAITLLKTADESALQVPPQVGDVISYSFRIENTGNVTLTNVTISDALAGVVITGGPIASMAPGDVDDTTYSATYVITQSDLDAGDVVNTATVTGTPPNGPAVTDESSTTTLLMTTNVPSGLSMVKTTPRELVEHGSLVPYTITITNTNPVVIGLVDVIDTLPMGLLYQPGSATLNGAPFAVDVNGAVITWADITIAPSGDTVLTLQARVLNGAGAGSFVNRVNLVDSITGVDLVGFATATVRVLPVAVFNCSTVVGKVFNDRNGDGYQYNEPASGLVTETVYRGGKGKFETLPVPQGEAGIPGVRLVTVDGLVITTDEFGRYSVPCASLPATGGSNFILKLDPRSLPAGYSITSENPRVVRLTPGMMTEVNFGASLNKIARVDLNNAAFDVAGAPVTTLRDGILQLAQSLTENPVSVVIAYHVGAGAQASEVSEAQRRMELVETSLRRAWRDVGSGPLEIQMMIVRAGQ